MIGQNGGFYAIAKNGNFFKYSSSMKECIMLDNVNEHEKLDFNTKLFLH